jgi:iron complex outermembrane receptor protein
VSQLTLAHGAVDAALTRVLIGTGLRPQHLDDHTIVIAAAEASTSDSGETKPLLMKASAPVEVDDQIAAPQTQGAPESGGNPSPPTERKVELEEIVVTGSHIRGVENKTNSVIVIDRAQIEQSGYSSTQDLFRSLPQNFSSGDATPDGIFGGNPSASVNSDFSSGVNLRGLGVASTLVLLNGHRLAPSAFGTVVDVSTIPLAAIDRIEILTEGASAIYGSDAVGGVVNIILRKDFKGADTSVRYGSVTDGARHEELVDQTLGTDWSGGNIVGTLQYQKQSALLASDRDFASALPSPSDLLPTTRSYAATLNARQTLLDGLELYGDVLLSRRDFTSDRRIPVPGTGGYEFNYDGNTRSINITPGLHYEFTPRWSIDLNGLFGQQQAIYLGDQGLPGQIGVSSTDNKFTDKSVDLIVNGHLQATPAGDIGIAVGGSYRSEDLNSITTTSTGLAVPLQFDRHVIAGFGEVYVPIVGTANRIPMVEALEFSASARIDKYSDFGSTTNPRIGLRWAPWTDFSVRASYGKSFRAPTAVEENEEAPARQSALTFPFADPAGGSVPVLVLEGSKPLTAERARTADLGLEYKPSNIQGLSVAVNYYDIRYQDRIITPAFDPNALLQPTVYGQLISPIASAAAAQAIVNAILAEGGGFADYAGSGVAGVRYLYNAQQQNAALVRQSGFDLTPRFTKAFGAHMLTVQVNISFIDKIDTAFAPGAAAANLVNTFGNPTRWRGRLDSAWSSNHWSLSAALNTVGSYVNTSGAGNPPIASWTTLDLNATFNAGAYFESAAWKGLSLSLIALNALNRDPPYVNTASSLIQVNYDPANANPLGRFVALELRKAW